MNCLIILPGDIREGGVAELRGAVAAHVRDVLKKGAGDTVLAGILNGPMGEAKIMAMDPDAVRIELPRGPVPPLPGIDVILAMPRPKVMKRLWAPLASLGVGTIAIIGAAKVETFYFASHALDPNLFEPRLIEGLAQARDTRLPAVEIHASFPRFITERLEHLAGTSTRLIAVPGDEVAVPQISPGARVVLAVGPEGGWTPDERRVFHERGFAPVRLGPRTLRTDTAIVALFGLLRAAV